MVQGYCVTCLCAFLIVPSAKNNLDWFVLAIVTRVEIRRFDWTACLYLGNFFTVTVINLVATRYQYVYIFIQQ